MDKLSIKRPDDVDDVNANIYNVFCKHVRSLGSIGRADVHTSDFSNLVSGVYLIQFVSEKGTTCKKILK